MDNDDFYNIFDDLPHLQSFPRLVDLVVSMPWFANLGNPPSGSLRDSARKYADLLGFPEAEPFFVQDPDEALSSALSHDINTEAWEREEQARATLGTEISNIMDEELATMLLAYLAENAASAIESGARLAAVRQGFSDEGFITAMIGAGAQSIHQAGLVALSGSDDHFFIHRFKLFEKGRWPITILGMSFLIF